MIEKIVEFPTPRQSDEEQFRRVAAEAERLANQSEVERSFWLPKHAEEIGVPIMTLKKAVNAVLREWAERTAAERLKQDRARV
jgi:hypothetical protein